MVSLPLFEQGIQETGKNCAERGSPANVLLCGSMLAMNFGLSNLNAIRIVKSSTEPDLAPAYQMLSMLFLLEKRISGGRQP